MATLLNLHQTQINAFCEYLTKNWAPFYGLKNRTTVPWALTHPLCKLPKRQIAHEQKHLYLSKINHKDISEEPASVTFI